MILDRVRAYLMVRHYLHLNPPTANKQQTWGVGFNYLMEEKTNNGIRHKSKLVSYLISSIWITFCLLLLLWASAPNAFAKH